MKPQIAKVLNMLGGKPISPLNVSYTQDSGNINNSVNNSNNRNYNNNNSVTNNNNNSVTNNNNSVNNSNNYNNSVRNSNSGNTNNSVNNSNDNSRNVTNSGNTKNSGNVTKIGNTVITHNYAAPAQSQVAAIVKRNFFVLPVQFPKNLAASFGTSERRNMQDIIKLALRTVPNSRISGKRKPKKADSRIYSAIVKFKENRVKNPQHAGVSVVKGLFGSIGDKLTEGIEPFVTVIDVEVSISSENRQTGDTIRETGRAYIRTDKFEDTPSAYREALANAVTDGANRLTSRIVGDVPEPWRKPKLFETASNDTDRND